MREEEGTSRKGKVEGSKATWCEEDVMEKKAMVPLGGHMCCSVQRTHAILSVTV